MNEQITNLLRRIRRQDYPRPQPEKSRVTPVEVSYVWGQAYDWFQSEFSHPQELKDPDAYATKLVERIEETFQIVGPDELSVHLGTKWEPHFGVEMTSDELKQKAIALEKRHKMFSFGMSQAVKNASNKDFLVSKLNGWFAQDLLDFNETTSMLIALMDHANLDTIRLVAQKGLSKYGFGENRNLALVLISRHYDGFKGEPVLESYLDRINGGLPKVVSAIREGKRLREAGAPYGSDLAVDEPEATKT